MKKSTPKAKPVYLDKEISDNVEHLQTIEREEGRKTPWYDSFLLLIERAEEDGPEDAYYHLRVKTRLAAICEGLARECLKEESDFKLVGKFYVFDREQLVFA